MVFLGVLPSIVFDPGKAACGQCPSNLALLHGDTAAYASLTRFGIRVAPVWLGLATVAIGWRLVRASRAEWRWTGPTLVAGAVYLALVAADAIHSARRGYVAIDGVDRQLWLAQAAALIALAIAVLEGHLRRRSTRSAVAQLVVELSDRPLADSLARNLGDTPLRIAYPIGGGERYVDADGRQVELAKRDVVTPVVRDGETLALVVHHPDDAGIADEVAEAAGLALENERLRAVARAQVEDLRQSRTRIVAAGDAERTPGTRPA